MVKDDRAFAVEIKSSVSRGDVTAFKRITESTRGPRAGN
ncbi:hypothetical protein [Vulcanisaeta sp. JCM 16159]